MWSGGASTAVIGLFRTEWLLRNKEKRRRWVCDREMLMVMCHLSMLLLCSPGMIVFQASHPELILLLIKDRRGILWRIRVRAAEGGPAGGIVVVCERPQNGPDDLGRRPGVCWLLFDLNLHRKYHCVFLKNKHITLAR